MTIDTGREAEKAALIDLLVTALGALSQAGATDEACRLAGRACAALRRNDPQGWRRFNVLLHRLSPAAPHIEVPARAGGIVG